MVGPQFSHTTSERRASTTIVGSLTRSGLFVPQDFVPQNRQDIEHVLQESEDEDGEETASNLERQPLLGLPIIQRTTSSRAGKSRRNSINILHDEASLLQANKIPIRRYSSAANSDNTATANLHLNHRGSIASILSHSAAIDDDEADAIEETWDDALKHGKIGTTPSFEIKSLTFSSIPLLLTFLLQSSLGVCSVFAHQH
ncbi:unnamed protein product [Ambrosiozyma monospora]|uniref:Unnamed protein product n=1 Tax=Ambrosiozyma monospora TaxID=43982 RepID=A0ACB5TGX6_AMBMO|nr:unnamed protein product [Ambrosiozyma monospora]